MNWTTQQEQAIDSRGRNLLVSAAAGSGKTAVLVERIVRMVTRGSRPLDLDQLLVMTFTKAAAAEMRERVSAAVDALLCQHPEDSHLALQSSLAPFAQITTIDSFCLNLIRSYYHELDIDPGFKVGDEGELSLLQGDVMARLIEEQYAAKDPAFERFVECYATGKSDEQIGELISQVYWYSQGNPWPEDWLAACLKELEAERPQQIRESAWMRFLLDDMGRQAAQLWRQMASAREVCLEEGGPESYLPMVESDMERLAALEEAAKRGAFEDVYRLLDEFAFDKLKAIRSKDVDQEKKSFVGARRDQVKKAVKKCRELYACQSPGEVVETIRATREGIKTLLHLARAYGEAYQEAKARRNIVDFNDLEHYALEVLLKEQEDGAGRVPTPVADELSRQYEEILVDEYQDSNYVQETLIDAISRRRFGSPNVFMVGDVKQSIYRFRQARPQLFMEKYDSYTAQESPCQKIELHQNFRSRASVLEGINDVFYRIMVKDLGGVSYTEETALHPGASFEQAPGPAGTPAELLMIDTGEQRLKNLDEDAADYTARELEAKLAAIRIKELVDPQRGLLVWDKEQESYRLARPGDIVILLRSMSGWSEVFVNVLMNQGISAFAQTRTGYFDTPEVETVLSVLSVLDNPMQDIPLAAVMKSPVGGLTDEEMAWMMAVYKKNPVKGQDRGIYAAWSLWLDGEESMFRACPNQELRGRVADKLRALKELTDELRRRSKYLPMHELLYQVYEETGYYRWVSAMPGGDVRKANLDMLVEKAAAFEDTSYKGLFQFVRYIEKIKKYNMDYGEAAVAADHEQTVRIMSIHGSKGLEFPIVILAGMGKRFNKQDAHGRILIDSDLGIAADFMDPVLRVKSVTLKKQVMKRRMELESLGEELRILYVAMTRAKEKLIMTAADRGLEGKLERWGYGALEAGPVPYTILSGAGSYLDWILMAMSSMERCGGPKTEWKKAAGKEGVRAAAYTAHIEAYQVMAEELMGEEVRLQIGKRNVKEDFLNLDCSIVWDGEYGRRLREALAYRYPYEREMGLYAMLSVSELKRRFQAAEYEETAEEGGALLDQVEDSYRKGAAGGSERGTAYHRALELMNFPKIHREEDVKQALEDMVAAGKMDHEAIRLLDSAALWNLAHSPLGRRISRAQEEGRLRREQRFMIGIRADELGYEGSGELVLVQGMIDAYLEEEDGLALIDYKTDRVRPGEEGLLADRYRTQLDYYRRALEQLTGKPVREQIIYSLALQKEIRLEPSRR